MSILKTGKCPNGTWEAFKNIRTCYGFIQGFIILDISTITQGQLQTSCHENKYKLVLVVLPRMLFTLFSLQ